MELIMLPHGTHERAAKTTFADYLENDSGLIDLKTTSLLNNAEENCSTE